MGFSLQKCNFCGVCLERCHYTEYTLKESAEEIKRLIDGQPAQITDTCCTCGACNEYCPTGANPYDLIQRRMEERGFETTSAMRRIIELSDAEELAPTRVLWGEADKPLIHACSFYDWIPNFYDRKVFEGATIMMGGTFATRLYWEHIGKQSVFKEALPQKVENIARVAAGREVVTMHDDCYAALTTRAMDWNINVPFKVTHQAEYLRDYLREHSAEVRKLNMKVAYHLPCAAHYAPWQNEWIDEVMDLIGCERVKRTYDRDNSICCGCQVAPRRGVELAGEVRMANIEDAKAAEAEAIIFQCPLCAINLREEAKAAGLEPYMLPQLCSMAVGDELPAGVGAGLGDSRAWIQSPIKLVKGEIREWSEMGH